MTDTSLAHVTMGDFYEALHEIEGGIDALIAVINEQLPATENMSTVMDDWNLTTDEKLKRMNEAEKYSVELRQVSNRIDAECATLHLVLCGMSDEVSGCDDI